MLDMSQLLNQKMKLVERPRGIPQPQHFALVGEPITRPSEGEILVRNHYLPLDTPMRALAVGEVIESKSDVVKEGEFLYGWFGWQSCCTTTSDAILRQIVPSALPLSVNLRLFGINGLTAHLAFNQLGLPRTGENVLFPTAAGSVGSFVGQLARLAGCRSVGPTNSAEEAALACARYGYAEMIDYRNEADLASEIRRACPEGNNIFFDNTGGAIADGAIRLMRSRGQVIQCGTAASVLWWPSPTGPRQEREVLTRRLRWFGFIIFDHVAEFHAAADELIRLALRGDVTYDEDISSGPEQAPEALLSLYDGSNRANRIVRLAGGEMKMKEDR